MINALYKNILVLSLTNPKTPWSKVWRPRTSNKKPCRKPARYYTGPVPSLSTFRSVLLYSLPKISWYSPYFDSIFQKVIQCIITLSFQSIYSLIMKKFLNTCTWLTELCIHDTMPKETFLMVFCKVSSLEKERSYRYFKRHAPSGTEPCLSKIRRIRRLTRWKVIENSADAFPWLWTRDVQKKTVSNRRTKAVQPKI